MIDLDKVRRYKRLKGIVKKKNEDELMDIKNLNDKELVDLINSTDNMKLLALAEDEYVNRHVPQDHPDRMTEEEIMEEINKVWRPS